MRSRIFSSKYIKTISKGQGWIPAFIALGFLLAFPVTGLVKLGSWQNLEYTTEQIRILYEHLWKDGFVLSGFLITVIAAIMNSINGFVYLYSNKKTDFYHGLPVKRAEMFLEKVVTGVIYYLIPYLIMEFLLVCVGAARGFFSMKLMGMAVQMLGLHLLLYLVIYFSIVLVICVTGNLLMGILCLCGMYLYGIMLNLLLSEYSITFLKTFCEGKQYGIYKFLMNYASPGTLTLNLVGAYADGKSGKLIIAIVMLAIVLVLFSWIAYQKRPSEAAGKSMVYPWIAVLVKFMVVVPAGLGIGWIFYVITAGKSRMLWGIFGLALGTVVAHGMIEVVYQMSFQRFFTKKIQLLLAGVLVAGCAIIYQKDFLHFDEYLPGQDAIASINVNLNSFDADYYSTYTKSGNSYNITDKASWDDDRYTFHAGDGIGDQTYQAVEQIVKNNQGNTADEDEYTYFTQIKYTLKSGREVYRSYWARADLMKTLVNGLYEEENLKEQKYSFLNLDMEYLNNIGLTDVTGTGYSIFQNDDAKMKQLLDAMKKDVEAAKTDDFMASPEITLDFAYKLPGEYSVNEMIPGEGNVSQKYADWIIGIYPSFKNTLAILKETGYPLTLEDLNINKIVLYYYTDSNEPAEQVTYEKPEEIEELKEAMISMISAYSGYRFADVGVSIYTEQGEITNSFELDKEKIPDFVQEKLDELGIGSEAVMVDEPVNVEEDVYTE